MGSLADEETRAKMSGGKKGANNPMFGKHQTGATLAKITASMLGKNKGKTRTEETRAKISATQMGNSNGKNQPNSKKIVVTDLELKTKTTFGSIREAARALNISYGVIPAYLRNNQKKPYKKRYVFSGFAPLQKYKCVPSVSDLKI